METYKITDLKDLPSLEKNSCIIGNFDGVHLGHQALLRKAKDRIYKTLVITFVDLWKDSYCLSTEEQRLRWLEELGADYVVIFPYSLIEKVFYDEFIKILKKLKVKCVTCGQDFRFGFKREGDIIDLEKHFEVQVLDYQNMDENRVSTTKIKELLQKGEIQDANRMLSRPYSIIGTVFEGNKIGRTLGFPTANILYKNYLLPQNGVYFVHVLWNNVTYTGMANIGVNPTLNLQQKTRLEVYILDFDQEIYGETLEIQFFEFLRKEEKYESREALIKSLENTVKRCRECEKQL